MIRIFVEDNELDINASFTHQITYAVNDLQNLDSKATAFTKTIVLPGTANNNKIFGNIFEFANSNFTNDSANNIGYNFNASKSVKARIDSDGLTIMKGSLRMLEIIVDGHLIEYEVALFGELSGFVTKLAAKKLTDLDFSAYNHVYNKTNIVNSWNNANAGVGYYYPLIDYGNVSTAKRSYDYRAFRPALFVREYIDKIIKNAGYTWESNFFNTNFFKRLIIPNNQNKLRYKKSRVFSASPTSNVTFSSPQVTFQNEVLGDFTTTDHKTYKYTGLTNFTGAINCNFVGTWSFTNSGAIAQTNAGIFKLYKNGAYYATGQIDIFTQAIIGGINSYNNPINFNITFNFGGFLNTISLVTNDEITIKFEYYSGNSSAGLQLSFTGNSMSLDTPYPISAPAYYGDNIAVSDTTPANILQKDFFTSIMKMFNLIVTEDKFVEKKLIIEPYVDFYDLDRTTYIDWSEKVDKSLPIHIKPMSEVNARFYEFKYKQDSDNYNEQYRKKYSQNYGDRVFDNGFEFAKETDKLEVIFSPTVLVGYNGEDKVVSTIFKLNNTIEESIEHNIRIMQAKKITGVANWFITNNGALIGSNLSYYGYAGHFDDPDVPAADLNFGAPQELFFELASGALSNNLFNAYYSGYMAEITDKDSRLITVRMRLKNKDIFNLDFGRFIWIDGVLYRLIKIYDYAEGELCKVDLLRVIYTTYYL
jgi:hypothetical protein